MFNLFNSARKNPLPSAGATLLHLHSILCIMFFTNGLWRRVLCSLNLIVAVILPYVWVLQQTGLVR
jgi:hypothetical protein